MSLFTLEDLQYLAGAQSYERGLSYLGLINQFAANDEEVRAVLAGQDDYRVRLNLAHLETSWCDCPWHNLGNFCKHCVAAGVYYLYKIEHGEDIPEIVEVEDYLESLSHKKLVALILEAAEQNFELDQYLEDLVEEEIESGNWLVDVR